MFSQQAKKGDEVERKVSHEKGKAPPPPIHIEKGPAPPPPVITPPVSPPVTEKVTAKQEIVEDKDTADIGTIPIPPPPVLPVEPQLPPSPPKVIRPPSPVLTPQPSEPSVPSPTVTTPSPLLDTSPITITPTSTPDIPETNIVLVQPTIDSDQIIVVPSPSHSDSYKQNTSTITINTSELSDSANSLATNISQVTVVTTHPPVLIDNSFGHTRYPDNSEVVIVANETNKTQINESSTDDECFPSLDSLEQCPPPKEFNDDYNKVEGQKLDESEVLIVNSSYVSLGDSGLDGSIENSRILDTSHVSVVTVGEDKVQVKDSASIIYDHGNTPTEFHGSTSDLSAGRSISSSKSDSGDEMRHLKSDDKLINGNILRTNVHKGIAPIKNFAESRSQSENSSVRSSSSHPSRTSKSVDHSDVESISTASQDSRGSNKENLQSPIPSQTEDEVILRKKNVYSHKTKENTRQGPQRTKEDIELHNLKRKTRKRTRKFEIDGVVVTTTTSKVIYGDDESAIGINEHIFRKQELRELKMLQKQEQKQFQDLSQKEHINREQQDKKFEQERIALEKTYENDLESLSRQQRQQVERAEAQQEADLRLASKKIRAEQERDLKQFREGLKQELRLLKTEIDMMPKDRRKNEFKMRKDKLESEHEEREKLFLEKLNENHESSLRRLSDSHRERIALMDRQFLQQKQQLMRGREAAIWELEEKQIHEKHQLSKRQLKDIFFLQRHQMLVRHEKELEQVKRMNQRKEEELLKRQTVEKRSLPKRIRAEMKAREMMFRESMRISISTSEPEAERDKLKKVSIKFLYVTTYFPTFTTYLSKTNWIVNPVLYYYNQRVVRLFK